MKTAPSWKTSTGAGQFVEDEHGRRPEGWERVEIKSVASFVSRGVAPKYDDESTAWVINQKCIRSQRLSLEPARRHKTSVPALKLLQFGDVLINSTGVGTLGRVAQVYEMLDNCTVDSHVTIVRPDQAKLNIDFFGMSLLEKQLYFESLGVGATGQTELGRERVSKTLLTMPPLSTQESFGGQVQAMRTAVLNLERRNANLRRTRDLLLPRLVSGELDVSALDVRGPGLEPTEADEQTQEAVA